jgi:Kef-type K+ transport system membrane component KefB
VPGQTPYRQPPKAAHHCQQPLSVFHPIFGAFLAGLVCPHDSGFALQMTEKIEDLISALFLPLYFALSGLNTNLATLNDGVTWGYVIDVIICAFAGKIVGGTLAARLKLLWRESLAIGCLMSCKGLVEFFLKKK